MKQLLLWEVIYIIKQGPLAQRHRNRTGRTRQPPVARTSLLLVPTSSSEHWKDQGHPGGFCLHASAISSFFFGFPCLPHCTLHCVLLGSIILALTKMHGQWWITILGRNLKWKEHWPESQEQGAASRTAVIPLGSFTVLVNGRRPAPAGQVVPMKCDSVFKHSAKLKAGYHFSFVMLPCTGPVLSL